MHKPLAAALCIFALSHPSDINNTEELLRAMHDRYASWWYRTLTFVQATTQYRPDGTKQASTWYEAFDFPGRMRIDLDSAGSSGLIWTRDSQFVFRENKLVSSHRSIHPLLLLGFDLYFLPTETTLAKLRELQFDLSLFREDTWQGRPVFVVGAGRDDSHSRQFWIDKEHLYFVRLLQPAARDSSRTQEVQFNKYRRLAGGWIAPEVVIKLDGNIVMTEEYSDIAAEAKLDTDMFEPRSWQTVRWR
jgi:hypothetical protein